MSEIKVNSIKGVGASAAAITVNNTDGTCTANLTNRTNKNLVVNGACLIAQRGTSSTTNNGYYTIDRIKQYYQGTDEAPTFSQSDVASGTTPYTLGFRKALKVTNGNQTSGAGASDQIQIIYWIEAQDIANSGWNYKSSSSFLTFSFWIKSSVAQVFNFYVITSDGTEKNMPFSTPSLSADTWTKVEVQIKGDSGIDFNNDNGHGLGLYLAPYLGTDYTDNSLTNGEWATYASATRYKDLATTWFTTNDATVEYTGLQLEVGSVATDFEHRSFAQELFLCQRYYEVLVSGSGKTWGGAVVMYHDNETHHQCNWVEKRATPSLEYVQGTNYYAFYGKSTNITSDRPTQMLYANTKAGGIQTTSSYLSGNLLQGGAAFSYTNNAAAYIAVSAEL